MIKEVLNHVFRKPATVKYPLVKPEMVSRFRGKLDFDAVTCIGCKICMRDCPSNAIEIKKIGDKRFQCEIDLSKCIYCAQCVDSCPKKTLEATRDYELASLNRGKLKVIFHAPDAKPTEPEKTQPQSKPDPKAP